MKHIFWALGALAMAVGFSSSALAANCSTYPYTLTNGQTADATQVMANFNSILSCANSNLAHNGTNNDITSINGLLTPLSVPQGGTGATSIAGIISNLGLGTAALQNTGTSGANVPLLNGANFWSNVQTVTVGASTTPGSYVGLQPTDFGVGKPGLFFSKDSVATTWDIFLFDGVNSTGTIGLIATQVNTPGTMTAGAFAGPLTGNVSGNATTATTATTANAWTTGRTITTTGDVTGVSGAWTGSANISYAATIAAGAVTNAKLASGAAVANIGYTPVNRAGDTMTGNLTVAGGASSGVVFNVQGFITGDNSTVTTIYTNVADNSRLDYNWSTKKLTWISGGTAVFSVDSSGNAIFKGNVTANGTP